MECLSILSLPARSIPILSQVRPGYLLRSRAQCGVMLQHPAALVRPSSAIPHPHCLVMTEPGWSCCAPVARGSCPLSGRRAKRCCASRAWVRCSRSDRVVFFPTSAWSAGTFPGADGSGCPLDCDIRLRRVVVGWHSTVCSECL